MVDWVKREKKKKRVGRLGGAWGRKKTAWWMLCKHCLAKHCLLSTLIESQTQSTAPGRLVKNLSRIPDTPSTHFHTAKHWICFRNRNSLFYISTNHCNMCPPKQTLPLYCCTILVFLPRNWDWALAAHRTRPTTPQEPSTVTAHLFRLSFPSAGLTASLSFRNNSWNSCTYLKNNLSRR